MTLSEFSESWPNPKAVWLPATLDTFLDLVVKSNFPLLSVGWYLFRVVTGNRYLPRGSNENTLCITSTGNVSVARWVIPLVTILLLDLVMIHWIQGKSFRENSNGCTHFWHRDVSSPTQRCSGNVGKSNLRCPKCHINVLWTVEFSLISC